MKEQKNYQLKNISQTNLDNRLMIKNKLTARLEEINAKIEDLKNYSTFFRFNRYKKF